MIQLICWEEIKRLLGQKQHVPQYLRLTSVVEECQHAITRRLPVISYYLKQGGEAFVRGIVKLNLAVSLVEDLYTDSYLQRNMPAFAPWNNMPGTATRHDFQLRLQCQQNSHWTLVIFWDNSGFLPRDQFIKKRMIIKVLNCIHANTTNCIKFTAQIHAD